MRVVFAGAVQVNAMVFQSVMQALPDCAGFIFTDLVSAGNECLENEPDLLLLDDVMPPHSGMALLEKFRARYPDVPVLMVLGQGETGLRLDAMNKGVSDFLSPPLDYIECLVRIKSLLALRLSRVELTKRTSWLADEVNEAYQAMELNASQAQEISDIEAINHALEQANRNKNDFLAGVGHDLRAPLTTILGYSDLLTSDARLASHGEELAVIRRNAHQLLALIDELLEFARNKISMHQIRPIPLYLPALLAHVMQQACMLADESGNRVTLEQIGSLPQVVVLDPLLIQRVLSNLLSNAAKFTCKGTLTLKVRAEPVDCNATPNQQALLFEVMDSGIGIEPADQERIFEPFFRTAQVAGSVPGTGLGLAICRQLVEAMGGCLTVESAPGRGSCFSLRLTCPLASEADVEIDELKYTGDIDGAKRQILLVEDVADIRNYLDILLSRANFKVATAANGCEALHLIEQSRERPVAVITDQAMPEMDGWGLLRAVRSRYGINLPVILLSSAPALPPEDWPDSVRFDATLLKPVAPGLLLNTLAQVLKFARVAHAPVSLDTVANIASGEMRLPNDVQLRRFQHWAEQGALSILESEAIKLAENCPEYVAFARFVLARSEVLDIEGVAAYCAMHVQ